MKQEGRKEESKKWQEEEK